MSTGYILSVTRGHNGGACLLKDGEIVFHIEEERLTRQKYDGGPYASLIKTLEYTDKIDYLVVAHTQPLEQGAQVDFSGDDVYTGLARKLGLIERNRDNRNHPQVLDYSHIHHKLHAAAAFYRSGWTDAVAVIVDGAGTFANMEFGGGRGPRAETTYEVESIIDCGYPHKFSNLYKHHGHATDIPPMLTRNFQSEDELGTDTFDMLVTDRAGITKTYEGVTEYCGFSAIEAGKTMGLAPYGKPNPDLPPMFEPAYMEGENFFLANRGKFIPTYPNSALYVGGTNRVSGHNLHRQQGQDLTTLENRRDVAYQVQHETQAQVLRLIKKAVDMSGKSRVVLSGGYGLNCVANYEYLKDLQENGIELYVEPISSDAGTCIGAALICYHLNTAITGEGRYKLTKSCYLGPEQKYNLDDVKSLVPQNSEIKENVKYSDVVDIIKDNTIVTIFQGRSESGPRALGNRSVLYNPADPNGKDHVNQVKRREYFRPFAGTILEEDVHDWFDLRGMESSPHMMYAVDCKEGMAEKIPSIIHVDGTCRIQTVNEEENPHYYNLIKEFKKQTGIPMVFNTSFNLGGEPLVETLEDAVNTLVNSAIEHLYLPELNVLVTIANSED